MGLLSTIGAAISSAVSGIGNALSTVARSVSGALDTFRDVASTLGKTLGPVLGKVVTVINVIVTIVEIAARIANLLKPQETVKDIGDRALQAEEEGITLETCDNDFNAYMEKLRALKLDPEKSAQHHDWEHEAAGLLVLEKGLELCAPCLTSRSMWAIMCGNPQFFSKERLSSYAAFAQESGMPLGESVAKYFSSQTSAPERLKAMDFMEGAERHFQPDASLNDIAQTLRNAEKTLSQQS